MSMVVLDCGLCGLENCEKARGRWRTTDKAIEDGWLDSGIEIWPSTGSEHKSCRHEGSHRSDQLVNSGHRIPRRVLERRST